VESFLFFFCKQEGGEDGVSSRKKKKTRARASFRPWMMHAEVDEMNRGVDGRVSSYPDAAPASASSRNGVGELGEPLLLLQAKQEDERGIELGLGRRRTQALEDAEVP
jgi:hypothetical protein